MSAENRSSEVKGRWNPITGNKSFYFFEPKNLGERVKRFIQFPVGMSAEETEKAYQKMLDNEIKELSESPTV